CHNNKAGLSGKVMSHNLDRRQNIMKKAVCVGINNYPGIFNDLKGCVNDARDWSALLQGFGFATSLVLDSQATKKNVKAALQELVDSTNAGDIAVFTYSGHGTQVSDSSGDEGDRYDEAVYLYDGTVIDDDLRVILNGIHPQATLVIISDSCFSGSVTRIAPEPAMPRFVPPAFSTVGKTARQSFLLPEAGMPEILISGCSDSEYSYDAEFNGRPNGAMTAYALQVIRQNPNITYREFFAALRALLPSNDYPQSPQLEGSDINKDRKLFEPLAVEPGPVPDPSPTPSPTPEPIPAPDSPGCLMGALQGIARLFK
ncbi:MAG TPA: caspase family protein, partial [Anaerolineales bacterium]|nr:caspase family protein [Anaerolineales bacterium]